MALKCQRKFLIEVHPVYRLSHVPNLYLKEIPDCANTRNQMDERSFQKDILVYVDRLPPP